MTYTIMLPENADSGQSPESSPPTGKSMRYTIELPEASVADRLGATGKEIGRQAGLTARHVIEGATALPAMLASPINSALGLTAPQAAVSRFLTSIGLPEPRDETERVVADISSGMVGAGGLAGAAGRFAGPIAKTLATAPGASVIGGGSSGAGMGIARESDVGPWGQLAAGLAGGFAAPATAGIAAEIAQAGGRSLSQLAHPFFRAGREKIVGNTLDRLALDPVAARANLADVPEFVSGSLPTTAQASADLGLLSAERALASANPQFAARKSTNIAARNRALDEIAGTPEELRALEAQRASDAAENYGRARGDVPRKTAEVQAEIADLQRRPAFQEAVRRAVSSLRNQGDDIATEGKPRAPRYSEIDPSQDDLITAIRKLGGLNPADEAIGSLAKANPFPPDPRFGPVWTAQSKMGSMSGSRGHSLDRMAQQLEQYGYPVRTPDDLMESIVESGMGRQTFSNSRDIGAAMAAEDPLASAIKGLTEQLGARNAPAAKVDFAQNGVKLAHETKLQLDDMIEHATTRGNANEARVLLGVRDKLLNLMERDDFSPAYREARQTYARQSVPINQMETGQRIQKQARLPGPDVTGEAILSQTKWQNIVGKNIDELGRTMSPEHIKTLKAIGQDLDRASLSDTAGRAAGSNTFQNLSVANVIGAGLGGKLANNAIAQSLLRPIGWLYKLPEAQVQDLLTQAMLSPSIARALMAKARPSNVDYLAAALKDKARSLGIGVSVGTATQ